MKSKLKFSSSLGQPPFQILLTRFEHRYLPRVVQTAPIVFPFPPVGVVDLAGRKNKCGSLIFTTRQPDLGIDYEVKSDRNMPFPDGW
jgi:hypothetical protein